MGACHRVLAAARWAPSGDNLQTWRFRILGEHSARITTWDTSDHVPYDHGGAATRLSLGMLFESIRIAASGEGMSADIRRDGGSDSAAEFSLGLLPDPGVRPDPLLPALARRATNRGWLSTRAVPEGDLARLAAAAAPLRLRWFAGAGGRWAMARLLFAHARVRLRARELWLVHRAVLDWENPLSTDRLPVATLPIDPVLRRTMRWAMASWGRISALNRWAAGDLMPALELDLLPAMRCASHVVFVAPEGDPSFAGQVAAGAAIQRFWLTASSLGLQLQPSYTPVAFHAWASSGGRFSADPAIGAAVQRLSGRWRRLLGDDAGRAVFAMRLGYGGDPRSRSMRLDMERLQGGRPA